MKSLLSLLFSLAFLSCSQPTKKEPPTEAAPAPKIQRPIAADNGKFFDLQNSRYLYGGEDSSQHFDVSNLTLKENQFHYGIGREAFPALLAPEFITMEAADTIWADSTRFLVGSINGETKAYSVPDLTRHEIVNDSLGGKPVMAAYCILADLGAIYERDYNGRLLTFGLSGYTYFDASVWDGLDGFVFWDRETESLWWPLIGQAVSGPLEGVKLLEMEQQYWEDISWKEVKEKYADVKVLASGQDFQRPTSWTKYNDVESITEQFRK
ncbi:MAG: DUF3179 domain-containing (seleno)protein [Reichenbachiella sp.]|uniref:DUF3179 domain-containing (seleno)protein n=1 Tax=Reichenbachiella sp. TaxID=2184521 RepID=UPI0029669A07|nr:DUF3179 domain-containing (seleno)protein [Reichenbachiella sp.]MDW3209207.1 DUF3179 domain-containing (seleno)protein [Reichenbachiella sp.]